jgi:hypothetical protein
VQGVPIDQSGPHLDARANGGSDSPGNIAAACLYCNLTRHRRKYPLPPEQYRHYVAKRMTKGGWLLLRVHQAP